MDIVTRSFALICSYVHGRIRTDTKVQVSSAGFGLVRQSVHRGQGDNGSLIFSDHPTVCVFVIDLAASSNMHPGVGYLFHG